MVMAGKGKNDSEAGPQAEGPGFEENLKNLEAIVAELEQGNLPLDRALKLYEEGMGAYRACHETLQGAEAKVMKLVETLEGALKEEPFDVGREEDSQ